MKNKIIQTTLFFTLIFLISSKVFADTHYVSKTGAHISPFNSWVNAATNIQAAINVAPAGNIVLVNDGTYYPGSEISVTKSITVKSVNGAERTIVDGNNTNRCFYLNSANPTIDGFTITNGYNYGNVNDDDGGGGVYCYYGGVVLNCTISGNSAGGYWGGSGGGVFCYRGGTVENCTISGNSASYGGGVFCRYGGTVQNCTISENLANETGGGVYCYYGGTVQNCLISENLASDSGGGVLCRL